MWQMECIVGTLNANVANKIILKMLRQHKILIKKTHKHPHQLLILKINLSILTQKKMKKKLEPKIHMNSALVSF